MAESVPQQTTADTEWRVAIRYHSTSVPSSVSDRARYVANDFATQSLGRSFDYGQDFVHLPSDFDTSEPKNIWILCDFNIRDPIKDVQKIPFQAWKVRYDPENKP